MTLIQRRPLRGPQQMASAVGGILAPLLSQAARRREPVRIRWIDKASSHAILFTDRNHVQAKVTDNLGHHCRR
jgi:hypothetical protein